MEVSNALTSDYIHRHSLSPEKIGFSGSNHGGAIMSNSAPYKASMRAKKLQTQELMKEFKAIEAKVTETNNQLASISQRITGIQKQLTDIEGKMPVKEKA